MKAKTRCQHTSERCSEPIRTGPKSLSTAHETYTLATTRDAHGGEMEGRTATASQLPQQPHVIPMTGPPLGHSLSQSCILRSLRTWTRRGDGQRSFLNPDGRSQPKGASLNPESPSQPRDPFATQRPLLNPESLPQAKGASLKPESRSQPKGAFLNPKEPFSTWIAFLKPGEPL